LLGKGFDDLEESSVSIVRLQAGWPEFNSCQGQNLSLLHNVQTDSGAHPASYPKDAREISLEAKWPGREANHSPPFNAEVKNGGAITPLPYMSSWHSV
jgi:hypothetical protein